MRIKYILLASLFLVSLLSFHPYFRTMDAHLLCLLNLSYAPGFILLLTNTVGAISVALPVVLLLWGWRNRAVLPYGIYSAASFLLALLTDTAVKYLLQKPRPFVTYDFIIKLSGGGSPSFPSGHTTDAFVTAGVVSLLCRRWYITAGVYLWALLVAYSRLALGVHYPSDVLAGAVLGTTAATICYRTSLRAS